MRLLMVGRFKSRKHVCLAEDMPPGFSCQAALIKPASLARAGSGSDLMSTLSIKHHWLFLLCALGLGLLVSQPGCGEAAGIGGLAPVTGTVTLDGQPLSGAQVVFIPVGEGRA